MSTASPSDPDASDRGRGRRPTPSMAELDAADMAEIAAGRTSADKDVRPDDPGPPPRALTDAIRLWYVAAVCGLFCAAYGFINLGSITDALRARLKDGVVNDPRNAAPAGQVDSLSSSFPPILLVCVVIALAVQYPLVAAIGRHHSRGARNFYVTVVVVTLVGIPIGVDLMFDYPTVSAVAVVIAWVQFALLALSMLFTMRRSVNLWLPTPMRLRPGGPGGSWSSRR